MASANSLTQDGTALCRGGRKRRCRRLPRGAPPTVLGREVQHVGNRFTERTGTHMTRVQVLPSAVARAALT